MMTLVQYWYSERNRLFMIVSLSPIYQSLFSPMTIIIMELPKYQSTKSIESIAEMMIGTIAEEIHSFQLYESKLADKKTQGDIYLSSTPIHPICAFSIILFVIVAFPTAAAQLPVWQARVRIGVQPWLLIRQNQFLRYQRVARVQYQESWLLVRSYLYAKLLLILPYLHWFPLT